MYCKKCGHENDADAEYCENCGANLSLTSSKSPKRMSTSNKILIVIGIVLVLSIGVTAGMLLTSKEPITNNTTNKTSVKPDISNITTETVSDSKTSPSSKTESIYADPDGVYRKAKEYVKNNYPAEYTVEYPVLGNLASNGTYYSYYMGIHDTNGNFVRMLKANAYSGELNP